MNAHFSLRISALHWPNPDRNIEILQLLARCPAVREVAFFTQHTHAPLPLAEIERRAAALTPVIQLYREAGLRVGINHLSTMGHMDENLDNSLAEPWQHLVDANGAEASGCYCLSDPSVAEYVRRSYRVLALAQPDFIWIDDDVRLESHGALQFACFCSHCLAIWRAETGQPWTREALVASFSAGTSTQRLAQRAACLEHNRAYVTRGIRLIRAAVDEVNPHLHLGFMTTPLPFSGAGFEEWARELSGERGLANLTAKWRPGGGFYHEDNLPALLHKVHSVGAQIAPVPTELTDVQYELENFPYQRLKKSVTIFLAEFAAAIGAGCTGAALNIMGTVAEPVAEFEPYLAGLERTAPFYRRAVAAFARSACEGIGIVQTSNALAAARPEGDWFAGSPWSSINLPSEWTEIGIPPSYGQEHQVTVLTADSILLMDGPGLERLLAGSMLLDGPALQKLNELGLGHLTGFQVCGTRELDAVENFTTDEINGEFGGWSRDCRQAFWPATSYLLEPQAAECRVLSRLVDFGGQDLGATSGIYENQLGGRIAVLGYSPWTAVHSLAKSSQLKSLVRWLSRDELPAYVASYSRCALWCRRDPGGNAVFMLLNVSLDAQDITVAVRQAEASRRLVLMDGSEMELTGQPDGDYTRFTIPALPAFQAALLV